MTTAPTRRLLWPLAAIVTLLLAGVNLLIGWRVAMPSGSATRDRLGDLHVYTGALEHLHRTGSLYTYETDIGLGFTYPPISAVLLEPLARVSADVVDALWTLAMLAAVVVCAAVVARRLTPPTTPRAIRYAVLAGCVVVLVQSVQVQSGLVSGNVSVLLTALCLLDVGEVLPRRWRGALVGLASAVKLTPLVFVPHYLITRQWGAVARSLGVLTVLIAVGWMVHPQESVGYWTDMIFETDRIGDLAFLGNQSAAGMLARLRVEGGAATGGWVLIGSAVGVLGLWRARTAHRRRDPVGVAVVLGCASVVASPVSWPFHQIWLPLAGLLLLARGLAGCAGYSPHARSPGPHSPRALPTWWVLLGAALVITSMAWTATFDLLSSLPGGGFVADNWQLLAAVLVVATGPGQERRSVPVRSDAVTHVHAAGSDAPLP